jgi:type II secretory pathway pseudopilin PulG
MSYARGHESGFTIVEVLVAALILVIAAMTTFGLLTSATKNTVRAKATQVALDRAQREVEKLRSLNNNELAMTTLPAPSASDYSPGFRVDSGSGTYALSRSPVGDYQKMVFNGGSLFGGGAVKGGVVNPGPVPFSSGEVSGWVYRYIVWRNDERCLETDCPGTQDYKQIVVAVKLRSPPNVPAERGYVEVQSNFVDPEDSSTKDPIPGAEGVVTAQQFYLSDTPCSASGSTTREEITGDHLLHNTLGTCSNGVQNGTTEGAPDALLLGGPPDPAPEDPNDPLPYDYSNDPYLEATVPATDKGLQLLRDNTSACRYKPTGSTNPQALVHRWVTDPMQTDFKMSGQVTLKIFSVTINNVSYGAGICVYLFKRHLTDTMLTNKVGGTEYWKYSVGGVAKWPTAWTEISVPMPIGAAPYTIPAGDRLGVAISLDPTKTEAEAISIMYDYPEKGISRLEVETTTPIDGG